MIIVSFKVRNNWEICHRLRAVTCMNHKVTTAERTKTTTFAKIEFFHGIVRLLVVIVNQLNIEHQ